MDLQLPPGPVQSTPDTKIQAGGKESGGEETVLYYHFGDGHILLCIHRNAENIIICKEGEGRRQPGIMGGQNERWTLTKKVTTPQSTVSACRRGREEKS